MVELVDIILALLIKVLIAVILSQLFKSTDWKKMAWPGFYEFVVANKLYCFAEPIYLRVSIPMS